MIEGVEIKTLKWLPDERGKLIELLRTDDEIYTKIGQVYITTAYPGVIKAWHMHKKQDDFMTVISGMMKIVIYDGRKRSPTEGEINEFFAGTYNPVLIKIPHGLYHGFTCISENEAYVVNIVTNTYNKKNPDEFRLPFDTEKIPYSWNRKNY